MVKHVFTYSTNTTKMAKIYMTLATKQYCSVTTLSDMGSKLTSPGMLRSFEDLRPERRRSRAVSHNKTFY